MTPAPLDEGIVERLLAGLEGVQPGPWGVREYHGEHQVYPMYGGPPTFGEWSEIVKIQDQYDDDNPGVAEKTLATHIANCSPENIRALLAEIIALRAQLAVKDEALRPFADAVVTAEDAARHFNSDHREDVADKRQISILGLTWGDLRRASAALNTGSQS